MTETTSWQTMLQQLKTYRERFDDCDVPQRWRENLKLANWVAMQRTLYKQGLLALEQRAQLDAIGFSWQPRNTAWQRMAVKLKSYKEEHGNCDVSNVSHPERGAWVSTQRARRKRGALSEGQLAVLDALGVNWDPKNTRWEQMFLQLKLYKEQFGDCNVHWNYGENPQLANWVSHQRRFQNRGILSSDRKARLDALGFDWSPGANKRHAGNGVGAPSQPSGSTTQPNRTVDLPKPEFSGSE